MRRLITTTALALVMAVPVTAQTTEGQTEGQQDAQTDQMGGQAGMDAGHHGAMQHGDLLATELLDAPIYAPAQGQQQMQQQDQQQQDQQQQDPQQEDQQQQDQQLQEHQQDQQLQEGQHQDPAIQQDQQQDQALQEGQQDQQGQMQDQQAMQQGQHGSRWGEPMGTDQLQGMENIGNVNDLLLDEQGNIQAVLVDVGGFLGMGARQVAIGLDQVNFITDVNDPSQVYIVTMIGADMLEQMPEFDQTAQQERGMQQDAMQQDGAQQQEGMQQDAEQQDPWRAGRDGLAAPDVQREGFQQVQADEISADDLLSANLYDVNDDNVGNVTDVVLGAEGEAQYIVADVGGFLGLGAHTVAIGFDEVSIIRDEGMMDDLRIYVDVTEDTLRTMPEYAGN